MIGQMAVIAAGETCADMAEFGKANEDRLRRFAVPMHDMSLCHPAPAGTRSDGTPCPRSSGHRRRNLRIAHRAA